VTAAQDEASPAALRRKTLEAQDLRLVEFEGVFAEVDLFFEKKLRRRYFYLAQDLSARGA
jgi:hypothetical protein